MTELEEIEDSGPITQTLIENQSATEAPAGEVGPILWSYIQHKNCVFARVEPWWTNQQADRWDAQIFFHTDFDTDDAYHITEGTPKSTIIDYLLKWKKWVVRATDKKDLEEKKTAAKQASNYQDRADKWIPNMSDIWLPKSQIEYAYHPGGTLCKDNSIFLPDGSCKKGSRNEADICIGDKVIVERDMSDAGEEPFFRTFKKFKVHCDYEDRDSMKSLEWVRTHREWDDDYKSWLVDVGSVEYTVQSLLAMGHSVGLVSQSSREKVGNDITPTEYP